jgi:hypothetical protein
MAYTITRLQIEDRARRKTDTVYDPNIQDQDLHDECNDLVAQAWQIVFAVDPDRLTTSTNISVVSGTATYTLPSDFMSLRRLDDDQGVALEPAPLLELDRETNSTSRAPRYRLMGGGQTGSTERIELRPTPNVSATFVLTYVATAPTLAADGSTLDCRFGEHVFIIAGLAGFIAERQESDSSPFRAAQMQARRDIEAMARKRDSGRAPQITDVRTPRLDWRARYPRP